MTARFAAPGALLLLSAALPACDDDRDRMAEGRDAGSDAPLAPGDACRESSDGGLSAASHTARRAASGGFSGAEDAYAELFALVCTTHAECETACSQRGGGPAMCAATECQPGASGGSTCLPPPIWTNLDSIRFEAMSLSEATQQVVVSTDYRDTLLADQFGAAIPAGAFVQGITVEVRRAASGSVVDDSVRLSRGGIAATAERASTAAWLEAFEWATYGGPEDLWGEIWTPEDVNADDFAVALSVLYTGSVGNARAYVDEVRATIHYRPPCD